MKAYRSRYAEIQKLGARVLAVSTDDLETMKRFRAELDAPQQFIPDAKGEIVKAYGVNIPLLGNANRVTFVIDQERKVKAVETGSAAVNPDGAIRACSLRPPPSK